MVQRRVWVDRVRQSWRHVKEEERGMERQKRKEGRSYHDIYKIFSRNGNQLKKSFGNF